MNRHLGQSGFSIIEIVVASVILAIVVGSSLTFMSNTETQDTFRGKIQQDNTCLAEAHKVIANIKDKGQSRVRLNFPRALLQAAGPYTFDADSDDLLLGLSSLEPGVPRAARWPTTRPVYTTNGVSAGNVIRPYALIMGNMNMLQAMLNSDSTFCTGTDPDSGNIVGISSYNDGSIIVQPTSNFGRPSGSTAPQSFLRIQSFNTNTGATGCGPVYVRPRGTQEANISTNRLTPPAAGPGYPAVTSAAGTYVFDTDSSSNPDIGFLVTATVKYVDRKGQNRYCSVQEKFQYNAQPANSLTLEIKDTTTRLGGALNDVAEVNGVLDINGTIRSLYPEIGNAPNRDIVGSSQLGTPWFGCGEQANHLRTINFRMARTRPGSIHMCRNLSNLRAAQRLGEAGVSGGTGTGAGTYDYAYLNSLINSAGNPYSLTGFMVRFSQGHNTTFRSTELLEHPYYRARDQGDGVRGNLVMGGLYYPETRTHSNGHLSPGTSTSGGYYCFGGSIGAGGTGCAGVTSEDTLTLVRRALPRSADPTNEGTWYTTGLPSFHAPLDLSTSPARQWQPCETLSNICDNLSTVTTAAFVPGTNDDNQLDAYHLRIDNLPSGCDVHIQIAEVDAGYNVKATEIREYIQEPQMGDKLCRKGFASTYFTNVSTDFAGKWFFACTTQYGAAASAPACGDGNPNADCCINYPDFPIYRPVQ